MVVDQNDVDQVADDQNIRVVDWSLGRLNRLPESLFGVHMLTFEHADATQSLMRTLSDITMPEEVAPHVTFVSGLFNFPHVNNLGSDAKPVGIPPPVTPDTLKKLYGLGTAKFSGKSNASQYAQQSASGSCHSRWPTYD